MTSQVQRRELFDIWRNTDNKKNVNQALYAHIVDKLKLRDCDDVTEDMLRGKCKSIGLQFQQKWQQSHSSMTNFRHKHAKWLDGYFVFDDIVQSMPSTSSGRPRKEFSTSSQKTKMRRVQPLLESCSRDELAFATQSRLYAEGQRVAATIIKKVSESPETAHDIKRAMSSTPSRPVKLSADEALSSFISNKLTRHQYIAIHNETKSHGADIYPIYNEIVTAKKRCYPTELTITEVSAEVGLQSLLDHTICRLVLSHKEVFLQLKRTSELPSNLTAIYKWGCDGASGHQRYKQKFTTEHTEYDDSFLFVVSCVPLQLKANDDTLIWQNPRSSSTAFCRPIKLRFTQESEALVREEVAKMEEAIRCLRPTEVTIEGTSVLVHHKLLLTMIDGKICGYLTGTPSANCFICDAKPKDMNNLESHANRNINTTALSYGVSSLHAWIKCLECILHISYRLDIKKWQARKEDKVKVKARQAEVRQNLRQEMGLLVDIPKPGSGTTNDGNTAKRFFANPSLASRLTGVSEELISRMATILRTLASGLPINATKFDEYAFETAKLYVSLYNWYFMPPTVHKLLIHGRDIITSVVVPIGLLSEEALEARHKECKRFREDYTRKFSRQSTMTDLMHLLLITSDPLISSLSSRPARKSGPLPAAVINLLQEYTPTVSAPIMLSSDESDYDE